MFNKIKNMTSNYPERIILGAAVLTLIYFFLASSPNQANNPELNQLAADIDTVKEKIITNKLPPARKPVPPTTYEKIKKIWDGESREKPTPANAWMMYRQPFFEVNYIRPPPPQVTTLIAPTISDILIDPKMPDRVTIVWNKNEEPSKTIAKTTGYKIYRSTVEAKDFKLIVAMKTDTITTTTKGNYKYIDDTVAGRTTYTYYVAALTDGKNVTTQETTFKKSRSKSVTTLNNVKIKPLDVLSSMKIYIQIEKFKNGEWKNAYRSYKKGELIGAGTSFETPYKITDIAKDTEKVKVGNSDTFITKLIYIISYADKKGNIYKATVPRTKEK